MGLKNGEFRKRLLATFRVEAAEHLTVMVSGLVELEKTSDREQQSAIVERTFREAHSLKGAARAVNLTEVEALCQTLESKFSSLKRRELALSPELFDELHRALDALAGRLGSEGREEGLPKGSVPSTPVPGLAGEAEVGQERRSEADSVSQPSSAAERSPGSGTVRIATAKLDALFLEAEELLSAKLAAQRHAAGLRERAAAVALWRRKRGELRPDFGGVETPARAPGARRLTGSQKAPAHLERVLRYLEWEDTFSESLASGLAAEVRAAEHDARFLAARVDALLEDIKRTLMLPFAAVGELFPKFVRDLAREQGKEIDLVITGSEVEVDKRILEEMKDPLIHLLRNSIDHGIEKPAERLAANKPARGTVTLRILQKDAGRVEVLVADDGAGVNLERVRAAAIRVGVVTPAAAGELDETALLPFIFHSGVSTNPLITDLSGRGLGLAIVREKVEGLGGTVEAETHRGAGTSFRMTLPVTLATFRGILARVEEHFFFLPASGVERAVRVAGEEIRTVENRETIELSGRAVSFARLGDVLGLPRKPSTREEGAKRVALVLQASGRRVALGVDEVLGEQEVLVKNPVRPLDRAPNLAGATIVGTGKVIPVLSVRDLLQAASRAGGPAREVEAEEAVPVKAKRVLVAEDSITARSLLKGILESAGYEVKAAVDGADAFAALKTEPFDLVVSDVDMPRLSGFDLTAKIRADKRLAELPVVLVTALESREDRERGIDVGASAYIVKSSFDQSNLLEVIGRLI